MWFNFRQVSESYALYGEYEANLLAGLGWMFREEGSVKSCQLLKKLGLLISEGNRLFLIKQKAN